MSNTQTLTATKTRDGWIIRDAPGYIASVVFVEKADADQIINCLATGSTLPEWF